MAENYGTVASGRKQTKARTGIRGRYGYMDFSFLLIICTLLVIGIIMMFSASYAWALEESGGESGTGYATKQMFMASVGVVAMIVISYIDYHKFFKPIASIGLYVLCVVLLLAVDRKSVV